VLELEVLIVELGAVDGLSTGAVPLGEVTSLEHELTATNTQSRSVLQRRFSSPAEHDTRESTYRWDHTVEGAPTVRQILARAATALLAGAEAAKVLGCARGDIGVELRNSEE